MMGFMGADIHGFIEVRNSYIDSSEPDDDELLFRWHPAIALDHVYDGRSYEAFGCLFGVRGGSLSFEPLAVQRGFPPGLDQVAWVSGLLVMPRSGRACSGWSRVARVVLAMLVAPRVLSRPMARLRKVAMARGAVPVWRRSRRRSRL
ncbi:hypothetical protein AMK20_24705 [Streptomyces sp. TSRI0261]|nr:hypothetical protein AMK20_24705 [Streptomyces sp. TSRI0261]